MSGQTLSDVSIMTIASFVFLVHWSCLLSTRPLTPAKRLVPSSWASHLSLNVSNSLIPCLPTFSLWRPSSLDLDLDVPSLLPFSYDLSNAFETCTLQHIFNVRLEACNKKGFLLLLLQKFCTLYTIEWPSSIDCTELVTNTITRNDIQHDTYR